jgi:hypothetical protein
MAVTFSNHETGEQFLIGGQASLAGADSGHAGTMPTYDITREEIRLADKTHLGFRYNITITGVATSGSNDVKTTKGEGQGVVMELARKGLADLNDPNSKNYGVGKLEIAPYGGYEDIISFRDARLVSVEMAEQDEETAGTQYQNYTYNFEAYVNTSNGGTTAPAYLLKEASESWSLSETGEFTYDDMRVDLDTKRHKVYTLTHTVEATGYRKYNDTTIDEQKGHAWKQAIEWVSNRLSVTESLGSIGEDLTGNSDEVTAQFNAKLMNAAGDTNLINLVTDGYQPTNKNRTIQSDIAAGTYSVTETYTLVKGAVKAFTSIETSSQVSDTGEQPNQVTVNGNIIGLSRQDFGTKTSSDKYLNALSEYNKLFNNTSGGSAADMGQTILYTVGKSSYDRVKGLGTGFIPQSQTLFPKSAVSFDESHDKANGTIEFSVIFSDAEEIVSGAYSCKVSVAYTNHGQKNQKPNPIGVVQAGPFMYLPGTTNEKTATFNVELKMLKSKRTAKPDGESAIDYYVPRLDRMESTVHDPRITSRSESWNPTTGVYTLSLTYTYV